MGPESAGVFVCSSWHGNWDANLMCVLGYCGPPEIQAEWYDLKIFICNFSSLRGFFSSKVSFFFEKHSAFKVSFHKEVPSGSAEFQELPENIAFYLLSCLVTSCSLKSFNIQWHC